MNQSRTVLDVRFGVQFNGKYKGEGEKLDSEWIDTKLQKVREIFDWVISEGIRYWNTADQNTQYMIIGMVIVFAGLLYIILTKPKHGRVYKPEPQSFGDIRGIESVIPKSKEVQDWKWPEEKGVNDPVYVPGPSKMVMRIVDGTKRYYRRPRGWYSEQELEQMAKQYTKEEAWDILRDSYWEVHRDSIKLFFPDKYAEMLYWEANLEDYFVYMGLKLIFGDTYKETDLWVDVKEKQKKGER